MVTFFFGRLRPFLTSWFVFGTAGMVQRRASPRGHPAPMKPILAVDVDGVISLFGFDEPPGSLLARFELIDGMVHCISLAAG